VHESQLFLRALELATPADRAAFLDEACAGNPRLRTDVEALLRAHESDPQFLESPAGSTDREVVQPPSTGEGRRTHGPAYDQAGTVLAGRYHLREVIGEGGMGAVWRADQTEPVRRPVAVKLIKLGMDTRHVLARFEVERQALALMDHTNIARVLDAGAAPDGRPFFVMDLVPGVPITRYCDDGKLTPRQRLLLFVDVCRAVQHAHQKGVIHRDLKPSNVLVTEEDGKPVPKVIDFGVAKAAGEPLTEQSLATGVGMLVGTPEYMSPEQANFGRLDVDTRADVYALGVLLYELLTGSHPINRAESGRAGVLEVLRLVREVEPPRPSQRLAAGTPPSVAENRGTDPRRLAALVRGDLDWIVMKCLEKDRGRRYETVNGLATDVERYMAGEPVSAAPPGAAYRMRKFVSRNRAVATAAGLVVGTLLLGIGGTTAGLIRANEARKAEAERADGEKRAKEAAEKAAEAEKAANDQITRGSDVLRSIFADLNADTDVADDRSVREALTARLTTAAAQLDGGAVRDPVVLAGLYHTLGESLFGLAHTDRAIGQFEKARDLRTAQLGPDHPDTLRSANEVAKCHFAASRYDRALPLNEESLRRRTATLGPDHPDTLESMNDLANVYFLLGDLDRAISLLEDALRRTQATLGPDHVDAVHCKQNLATVYLSAARRGQSQRVEQAGQLYVEAHQWRVAKLGPDHMHTLASLSGLALYHQAAGRLDQALPLIDEVYRRRTAKFGPDHPQTINALNNLAFGYFTAGRFQEAIPLFEEAVKRYTAKLGPGHNNTLNALFNLASCHLKLGQPGQALPLVERTVAGMRKLMEPNPIGFAASLANTSQRLFEGRQFAAAEPYLRESLAIQEKLQPDGWFTFHVRSLLGGSLLGQGKLADAEPLLLAGYDGMKQREKSKPQTVRVFLPDAADRLVELYERLDRPDEVTKWRAERARYPFVAPPPRPAGR
jgi:tetratricopeptide (TPR) repeat protein